MSKLLFMHLLVCLVHYYHISLLIFGVICGYFVTFAITKVLLLVAQAVITLQKYYF